MTSKTQTQAQMHPILKSSYVLPLLLQCARTIKLLSKIYMHIKYLLIYYGEQPTSSCFKLNRIIFVLPVPQAKDHSLSSPQILGIIPSSTLSRALIYFSHYCMLIVNKLPRDEARYRRARPRHPRCPQDRTHSTHDLCHRRSQHAPST